MLRRFSWLAMVLALAACGAAEPKWAPEDQVQAARYVHDGPPTVTLFTVLSTRSGNGAHAGLMVNADERVMFDPAGTWQHPRLPERNDVHFGMTPKMVNFYIDYHARETYDVVEQTIVVSPAVAALVKRRVQDYGAVPKAQCTVSTSKILRGVPGFEGLPQTWYPKVLMEAFGQLPGVTTRKITDDDADDNHGVLLVQAGDPKLE
jgi:predicted small lipoprotein YifL